MAFTRPVFRESDWEYYKIVNRKFADAVLGEIKGRKAFVWIQDYHLALKYSGLLCHSIEGASFALKQLLNSPEYAKRLGENGREHVRNNFLITRHIKDYLLLFLSLYYPEDIVYL